MRISTSNLPLYGLDMPDYNDIKQVLELLSKAQEVEKDNRDKVREVINFVEKEDGQWEPAVISQMNNRPRYTFDKCNPVVDSIAGEMEMANFDIRVRPAGGDASKDVAKVLDGMIRNIENISNAPHVYNQSGRNMVTAGFDAWRVVTDWADADSFDQDILIKKIANAVDRVWFDPNAEMQDMSDANYCFVLQALTKDVYDNKFPKGSGMSVGDSRSYDVYYHKATQVIVGEFIYKKPYTRELALMSNGKVYEIDDDYKKVKDELSQLGVTEVKIRNRKSFKVMSRKFDGKDWLESEKELPFSWIPVVPTYGNFKISENKVIYRGVVNHLMDAQRVYNYAQSRAIEEGALAPRGKYWMTRQQAAKDLKSLQTLNTNADPVQTYTHVDGQNPPFWQGGAQINAGLQQTAGDMAGNITESSGIFAANQGESMGANQSGIAIEKLQNKGDTSTVKYFSSQEMAICHTAKIIIDAIPKVYDTQRQVRILNEDGSFDMQVLNEQVFDQQSGQMITLNDLSMGTYDVTCEAGTSFKNRQQEAVRAITEIAQVDPTIIQTGADVLLNNITSPGIDVLAKRTRSSMIQQGLIPQDQWTDEETEQMQQQMAQAEGQQQPDPMMVAAQAEMMKAEADRIQAETEAAKTMADIQAQEAKSAIDAFNAETNRQKVLVEAKKDGAEIDLKQQDQDLKEIQAVGNLIKTDNQG